MENLKQLPFEQKSIFHIDPRTKIFLTITVTTIMCAGKFDGAMIYIRPMAAIFPILMLLFSMRLKAALKFFLFYAILFCLSIFLFPTLKGAFSFMLGAVLGIYTQILPGIVMGYYLIDTTTVSEFIASMEKMHIPEKIIIPMSVVFRFFPTVKEEYRAIQDAMKMRGITTFRSPIKMLEYRIVPLMISITKIGEELSAAALTRGLGSPTKRTNICKIGFNIIVAIFIIAALICWIGFLV